MRLKIKWIYTLLLAMVMQFSFAQEKTVSGVVSDGSGPVPGANVIVRGTKNGVQTDFDGKYAIKAKVGDVLVISFVGMQEATVKVGAANTLNVKLQEGNALNEVVVTSFGIQRDRKSLGYSTPKIDAAELTAARATNVTNQLAGKVAGVQVSGSGGAFTGSSVIIRGFTTFTGSNQPLYVVDGVPIDNSGGGTQLQTGPSLSNRAGDVNPEDIESVVVLKDAASTALYGSRGASGVILITTKKGKKGQQATVTFNSSLNAGVVNRLPDYQNEYAQGFNGTLTQTQIGTITRAGAPGVVISSWGPKIDGRPYTNSFGQPDVLRAYPNNVKDIFQTALTTQNNLSVAGGNEKSTYRIAYGNTQETYVIDNNRLIRNNLTFTGNTQVTDKLTIGASMTYTNNNSNRTLQGNQLSNPLFRAYITPRSYDLTGLPFENATGGQTYFGAEDNPYWTIKNNRYNDRVNRILANINGRYEFNSWLNADFRVGTDFFNQTSKGFDEIGNRGGGFTGALGNLVGGIVDATDNVHTLNSYFTLNANKKFGDFALTASVGNEYNSNYRYNSTVFGRTLVVPGFDNIKNALNYAPSTGTVNTKLFGVFADVALEYKKFLSVNVKARNDFSSTLSPENNSIFYPAVSGSFVLTEAFSSLKSDKINLIKFRVSAGEVGKGAGAYGTDSYYLGAGASDGFGPQIIFPFNSQAGFTLSNGAGNANLTPEFTREVSFGAEMAFFNNRLTIDGSIYNRSTRNVILSVPVSAASGVTSVLQNAGKLSTKGVELLVSGTPIKTANFSWDLGVNYTQFRSMVDELAPGVTNIFLGGFTTPNIRLVAGDQYGQIYGNAYQRNAAGQLLINPTTGLPLATPNVQKIGNPNPDFTMGITNNLTYKNLSLFVLLDIRQGGDQYSRNIADVQRNGVAIETAEFNRFNADGTVTKPYKYDGVYATGANAGQPNTIMVSAQDYFGNSGKYVAAEGFIYDTSWFRVREMALNYKLPSRLLANSPFKQFEIGVFGRNLFLHAPNYPHFDPEQNALGISNAQGLEFNSLPNTRTFGVNLNLVF